MTDQIFISYSKKDSDFAHKLADDLEAASFKIWIDKSIGGGDLWRETIEKNLKAATEVIIVISANSMASEWVKHEGSLSYGWGKKLFPVLIEPVETLPPWLEEYQWSDFVNTDYEIAIDALIDTLTPPNPIQDLLNQQIHTYEQTGDLIGEALLQVVEDAIETLVVDRDAQEVIDKSKQAIAERQRREKQLVEEKEIARQRELEKAKQLASTQRQRAIVLALGFVVAIGLSVVIFIFYQQSDQQAQTNATLAAANQESAEENAAIAAENIAIAETAQALSRESAAAQATAETARDEANQQAKISKARELAANVTLLIPNNYELAGLLSIEAFHRDDNFQTRQALYSAWRDYPVLSEAFEIGGDAYSQDGRYVATAGCDPGLSWCPGIVQIFDTQKLDFKGEPLTGFLGYQTSMAFNPEGTLLAAAGCDSYDEYQRGLETCQFSELTIWDLEQYILFTDPITGLLGGSSEVTINSDGSLLAASHCFGQAPWDEYSGCAEGEITIWALTPELPEITRLTSHISGTRQLFFVPGKDILAALDNDSNITFWDITTALPIHEITGYKHLLFTEDGANMITVDSEDQIVYWDTENFEMERSFFPKHSGPIYAIAISKDGKYLVSGGCSVIPPYEGCPSSEIRIWNVQTGRQVGETISDYPSGVQHVQFDWNGDLLVGMRNGQHFHVNLDTILNLNEPILTNWGYVNSLAFNPEGSLFASAHSDGSIRLYDLNPGQQIEKTLTGHTAPVQSVVFNSDGTLLASGSCLPGDEGICEQGEIRVWDLKTMQLHLPPLIGHSGYVISLAFSPDGTQLASGGIDNSVNIWDLGNGSLITGNLMTDGDVWAISYWPDGSRLISGNGGSNSGSIIQWNTKSWSQIGEPIEAHKNLWSFTISPDHRWFASGGCGNRISGSSAQCEGEIKIWDSETGHQIGEPITGDFDRITSLTFSQDGNLLLSGSCREYITVDLESTQIERCGLGEINIWDPISGQPFGTTLIGHTGSIYALAFQPNGSTLISGGTDGDILIWDFSWETWEATICARVGRNLTNEEWVNYFSDEPYAITCSE